MESCVWGYTISANIKQQGRRSLWRLGHIEGGFRESGNHRCPSLVRIPKCPWVTEASPTAVASTFSHAYEYRTYRYSVSFPPPPPSVSLCFYLVFSDCIAYQHRSTGHDLSLRQKKARERPWNRMGCDGSFILLMQGLSEQSLFTKGMQVQFLLLNKSAFYTKSLKQIPMSHQLSLVQAEVGFKRASCAKAKQKHFDFHVIPPCCWSSGPAHAGWWWLWWCQSKRAQSGFGGVQSEEGGWRG